MSELSDQFKSTLGAHYNLERKLSGGGMARVFVFVAEERRWLRCARADTTIHAA